MGGLPLPQGGVAMGSMVPAAMGTRKPATRKDIPLGAMGTNPNGLVGPKGPWHPPCLGGENTLARGSQGWMFTWVFPYVILPDGPQSGGSLVGPPKKVGRMLLPRVLLF